MKSYRVPESNCTSCGERLDAAGTMCEGTPAPKPGDITICVVCGQVMQFTDTLGFQGVDDPTKIPGIHPDDLRQIRRAQEAVAHAKGN